MILYWHCGNCERREEQKEVAFFEVNMCDECGESMVVNADAEFEVGLERDDGTFKHVSVAASSAEEARERAKEEYNDRYGEPEWFVYQTHNLDTGEEIRF